MDNIQTSRRITPTGHLILSADANREAWLTVRRHGITATDVPAILGLNKYKTAIDVWMDKVSPADDTFEPSIGNGEAALWGTVLEDTVAKTWAEHRNVKVRRVGVIAHNAFPWARASLDRLVTGCPDGRCAVEVKTRSHYVADEWDKSVPKDVQAQVEWQLLVSGLDHIHVIALIGGQRLVEHVQFRINVDLDDLLNKAELVWKAVQLKTPPELPSELWTEDYLEQLHPVRDGSIEVSAEVLHLFDLYKQTLDQIKQLDSIKNNLRTELIGALGDYDEATFNSSKLYSYKQTTTKRLNTKAIKELYPEVNNDDRVWAQSTSRTFRITTNGEETP